MAETKKNSKTAKDAKDLTALSTGSGQAMGAAGAGTDAGEDVVTAVQARISARAYEIFSERQHAHFAALAAGRKEPGKEVAVPELAVWSECLDEAAKEIAEAIGADVAEKSEVRSQKSEVAAESGPGFAAPLPTNEVSNS